MKKTTFIVLCILLGLSIGIASAITIVAGNCSTIEFPNSDPVQVNFEGNSSPTDGFYWEKNGTLIEYCVDWRFQPDNFTVTWFNYQERGVQIPSGGGGGGTCVTKWSCSDWSECVDGVETRTCSYPDNFCEPRADKPNETQPCVVPESEPEQPSEDHKKFIGSPFFWIPLILLVVLSVILGNKLYQEKKKKEGNKN